MMPDFSNFQFNGLSFWLGFLAATLFWFIFSRVRQVFPKFQASIKARIQSSRRKAEERLDEALRGETLRQAQSMHAAAALFPLDEVLIEPSLLAPPPEFVTPAAQAPDSAARQVIPYLPDWPELAAQYNVATLTAAEALQNGARLAVTGQPGSGKSMLLAALASQIARRDPRAGNLAEKLPVLLHVLDLTLDPAVWTADPLAPIVKLVTARTGVMLQSQMPAFLRAAFTSGSVLLVLDGLDELARPELVETVKWLSEVLDKTPQISVIAAAAPENLDGLTRAGFLPLAVSSWNRERCEQFLDRWSSAWVRFAAPEMEKLTGKHPVDSRLLNSWLQGDGAYLTPLEWTLRAWGAFSGDLAGGSAVDAVEAHLRRLTQDKVPYETLASLALEFVKSNRAGIAYADLDSYLSSSHPELESSLASEPEGAQKIAARVRSAAKKEVKVTSGGRILNYLIQQGLLVVHPNVLRFSNPVFTGFLAACAIKPDDAPALLDSLDWCCASTTGHYLAASNAAGNLINLMLSGEDTPVYSRLLTAARWLRDASGGAWKSGILRRLVTLLQNEILPTGLRARFIGAFVTANDPAAQMLFKQLMLHNSAHVRQLAALGCGAARASKLADDLMGLLADPNPDVRFAALLALAACQDEKTGRAVDAALAEGDEGLQLAAAEALSGTEEGQEKLRAALETDNLMLRRAAVFGLSKVQEDWARKLLEKTAVEDGQWVVRSAAAQAVESRSQPNPFIPAPLPAPHNAAWLLTYASKQGIGIAPGEVPIDLMLSALKSGSQEEKLAALAYLRALPEEGVVGAIYQVAYGEQCLLREAAFYSVWSLAASGIELPSPAKYGFS